MFIHISLNFYFCVHPNSTKMRIFTVLLSIVVLIGGCTVRSTKTEADKPKVTLFTTQEAPEWNSLFLRSHGWFGGDGIFALPYSGRDQHAPASDSILFLFSDTLFGDIEKGEIKNGYAMVNNSVMILHGKEPRADRADFLVRMDKDKKPVSLFTPATPQTQKDDYFWLEDGFVNNEMDGSICIFALRIRNTNDGSLFPFMEAGNTLIVIPKNEPFPYKNQKQYDIPFSTGEKSSKSSYGSGVLCNSTSAGVANADGFVYMYGIRGPSKELLVSRVKPSSLTDFKSWEFYDGTQWTSDASAVKAVADSISNEMSVSPLEDGQYALVYQLAGFSNEIFLQLGPTPYGPFGPRQHVYNTAFEITHKNIYAYNAKAHTALSKPGELLISYNINTFDFENMIGTMPNMYRPRFIRVKFNSNAN